MRYPDRNPEVRVPAQNGPFDEFSQTLASALARTGPHAEAEDPEQDPRSRLPLLDAPGLAQRLGLGSEPRYQVRDLLGAGGLGRVLLVEDANLRREIAVKTPLPSQVRNRAELEAFIGEARVTASLEHPGIVPILDLDLSADGQIFYAMRRVHGRSLGALLEECWERDARPVEIATCNALVTILLKVCDAIAYAHSRGVIHRDLKPDNIMIGRFGEVLVLDWGASSPLRGEGAPGAVAAFGTPIYMSPEQARREAIDERSDIWSLGATLFHCLLLRYPVTGSGDDFWRRKYRGELDGPTAAEITPLNRPLLALACKAMAPLREDRYQTVAALADDLRAYQAGQAMVAYRGSALERFQRWHQRWKYHIWAPLAMVLVLATAVGLVWGERLKEVAAWGSPVIAEDFRDESWLSRWTQGPGTVYAVQGGHLVSTGVHESVLRSDRAFAGPVAIEFDGRITPGSPPCDLSVVWFNGDGEDAARYLQNGWLLQAGAYDNSFCAIHRVVGGRQDLVARSGLRLVPGRVHHLRAVIEGTRLTLWVDGQVAVAFEDLFPIQPGHIGIYTYYPGKSVDHVRVYAKGVAERMSPIALGDDRAQDGQYASAIERYRQVVTSHPDGAIADEAWYKMGYCYRMLGRTPAAWEAWRHVSTPPFSDRVQCQQLDRLFAEGRHEELLARLPDVVARSQANRILCEGLWVDWLASLPRADQDHREGYLEARERLFPGNGPSVTVYGRTLNTLQRYDQTVRECGDDPLSVCDALVHAGRVTECIARFGYMRERLGMWFWHAGDLEAMIRAPAEGVDTFGKAHALAKRGRIQEALALPGARDDWRILAAAGDWGSLMERRPDGSGDVLARIALGRLAEAADGRYRVPTTPSALGLLLSGRHHDAELAEQGLPNLTTLRLIAALHDGDVAGARRLAEELGTTPVDWMVDSSWFGPCVLVPFLAQQSGDRTAWPAALQRAAETRARAGQRLWYLAGFLAGRLDGKAFLAQPFTAEAEAWLQLATGIRAEVSGDRAAARTAYAAYQALPLEKRLLEGFRPSPVIERFVAWRAQAP